MIEIRHATEADILEFYGKLSEGEILTAYSIVRNGVIEAIAGIVFENGHSVFFSDIRDGLVAPKITIWRVARNIVNRIKKFNIPVYAVANCDKPNAERFLQNLGFEFVCEANNQKVYKL